MQGMTWKKMKGGVHGFIAGGVVGAPPSALIAAATTLGSVGGNSGYSGAPAAVIAEGWMVVMG